MKKTFTTLVVMLMAITITHAQWTHVGGDDHPLNADGVILSLVSDQQGNIYASGEFKVGDSISIFYVAQWSGDTAWLPLGTGSHALNACGYIYSLATDAAGSVYAAGAFTDSHFLTSGNVYVAKWTDTSWTELGTTGVTPAPPTGHSIYSIGVDPLGNAYAAGSLRNSNGKYYVSKWDGTDWAELGTGANALNANHFIKTVAIDPSGHVFAAGDFTDANGQQYVAEWDGTTWTELGTGTNALGASSPIQTIATDPTGNLYVAYNDSASNFYVAKWNGTNWSELASATSRLQANNAINTITSDQSGNIYAAGNFTDANGNQYVAKWDGTAWTELGTGANSLNPNGYILTIAADPSSNIYAAGFFTDANTKYFVAEYDPNTQTADGVNNIKPSLVNDLQVVPNPSSGNAAIDINSQTAADVKVSLCDMTGREVAAIYQGALTVGDNKIAFHTENISSGVYLVKAFDGHTTMQTRFVKM